MISFCYFQKKKKKKNGASFWVWPILAQLLPKYGPRIAIFNNLSVFFQNYNMITQVININ